jgi:hypothetical protein
LDKEKFLKHEADIEQDDDDDVEFDDIVKYNMLLLSFKALF